jgi:hypothetical protein
VQQVDVATDFASIETARLENFGYLLGIDSTTGINGDRNDYSAPERGAVWLY